ncbi:hypothetical protein M0813_24396 [Anaeramoeba flamelloides]|uniref:Protein kinase domain-containing protein n=1 Tax=Anaeramoeba flamelloides TaxID=1746091 RepID=A0AAV7Z9M5_9EUKA|nr:hypothetical protein M0812_17590 [Anaeramoeba flamelloides]KAJ6240056.1 hypothetical protein M0813_24396 [Anaeramoeba flamelloides]
MYQDEKKLKNKTNNLSTDLDLTYSFERLYSDPNQVSVLSLDDKKLKKIPMSVFSLVELEILSLEGNKLSKLPFQLYNLKKLNILDTSNNELDSIPKGIGNLTELNELYLQKNKLESLPSDLFSLPNLRYLCCFQNKLKQIPNSICGLVNLRSLSLSGNSLSIIPGNISELTSLTKLYLRNNKFTTFPIVITALSNLTVLCLSVNKIEVIPRRIEKMKSLKKLFLSKNIIKNIPNAISKLENLQELGLNSNKISRLPHTICQIQSLKFLDLSDNKIVRLPNSIGKLINLVEFFIARNNLEVIPEEISNLKSLTNLNLSGNLLTKIPNKFGILNQLTILNVNNNPNLMIPSKLLKIGTKGILSHLKTLIPAETSESKCLTFGEGLWGGVSGMKSLFTIHARDANGTARTSGGDDFAVILKCGEKTILGKVRDRKNGTYTCSYVATKAGEYLISVTLKGNHIAGSPFVAQIEPGQVDGLNCTASGPGIRGGLVGEPTTFMVYAHDKFGNSINSKFGTKLNYYPKNSLNSQTLSTLQTQKLDISVILMGPTQVIGEVTDSKNAGEFLVTYVVQESGTYSLIVKINSSHICDSPFKVHFERGVNIDENPFVTVNRLIHDITNIRSRMHFMTEIDTLSSKLQNETERMSVYQKKLKSLYVSKETTGPKRLLGKIDEIQEKIRVEVNKGNSEGLKSLLPMRDGLRSECRRALKPVLIKLNQIIHLQTERSNQVKKITNEIGNKLKSAKKYVKVEKNQFNLTKNIQRYWNWREKVSRKLSTPMTKSDQLLIDLIDALFEEKKLLLDKNKLIDEGQEIATNIIFEAQQLYKIISQERPLREQFQTIEIKTEYSMMKKKLENIERQRIEIERLKNFIKNLNIQKRQKQEELIDMEATLKRLELDGADPGDISNAMKSINIIQEKINQREFEQKQISNKLLALADEHPELFIDENIIKNFSSNKSGGMVMNTKFSDYERVQVLGYGSHRVFLMKYKSEYVVLKEFLIEDEKSVKQFEKEVQFLKRLKNPLIIKIKGTFYDHPRLLAYILMPYFKVGSMQKWVNKYQPNPWKIRLVFRLVLKGIKYLHKHNVIHRDLKLENVLMSDDFQPVICDFGISKDAFVITGTGDSISTEPEIKGTRGFIAPEIIEGEKVSTKSDMWSFGIMLYKAHYNELPTKEVLLKKNQFTDKREKLLWDLMRTLTQIDPGQRPEAKEARNHPYFKLPIPENEKENILLNKIQND